MNKSTRTSLPAPVKKVKATITINSLTDLIRYRGFQKQEINSAMDMNHMTMRNRLQYPLRLTRQESDKLCSILKITAEQIEELIRGNAIELPEIRVTNEVTEP